MRSWWLRGRKGNLELVEVLVKGGAKATINEVNKRGLSPLGEAVAQGHDKVAAFLLRQVSAAPCSPSFSDLTESGPLVVFRNTNRFAHPCTASLALTVLSGWMPAEKSYEEALAKWSEASGQNQKVGPAIRSEPCYRETP